MRIPMGAVVLMLVALAAGGCGEDAAEPSAPAESASLFLAGDGELWVVDPAAETSRHIKVPELSPGDAQHRIAVRGDRLVLWGYDTWAVDAHDPAASPERIARDSWIWIPSMHPDRVWVGFLEPEHDPYTRPLAAVREIDADGRVTVPDARPPGGAWPEVALDSGLILTRPGDRVEVELWDPRSREIRRQFRWKAIGDLGPAFGDRLASCTHRCQTLVLTDFATGNQRSIQAPGGQTFDIWEAAISPDGATIATPIRKLGNAQAERHLALVSLDAGSVKEIPGSRVPFPYNFVVWASGGEQVFLMGRGFDVEPALVSYSPGDESAQRVSVELGRFYDAAAG